MEREEKLGHLNRMFSFLKKAQIPIIYDRDGKMEIVDAHDWNEDPKILIYDGDGFDYDNQIFGIVVFKEFFMVIQSYNMGEPINATNTVNYRKLANEIVDITNRMASRADSPEEF